MVSFKDRTCSEVEIDPFCYNKELECKKFMEKMLRLDKQPVNRLSRLFRTCPSR